MIAGLVLLLACQGAPADSVAAPPGMHFSSALLCDLDLDGRLDLLAALVGPERSQERRLAIHLQRAQPPAFVPEPDFTLGLGGDVTVFAAGDFHADAGREVVLCNAGGVFLWRPRVSKEGRLARLLQADVLWQVPEGNTLSAWPQLVQDLDQDRLDDLLVPGPGGFTLARQERAATGEVTLVPIGAPRLPAETEASDAGVFTMRRRGAGRTFRIEMGLSGSGEVRGPLVTVDDAMPAPVLLDFDGDGRRDLWALDRRTLHVWTQDGAGRFASAPAQSHVLPVARERRLDLDISYSAHAADLDGDRKGDLVLLAGERGSDRGGTQVLVFVQGRAKPPPAASQPSAQALFGAEGIPQQLLVLSGIAGAPRLADVDGDGRPDLIVLSFRPDMMDLLKAASSEKLTSEVLVFRNQGGLFARRPDLQRTFEFSATGGGDRERMRWVPDLDGDLAAELLVRTRADEAALYHFRRRRDALLLDDEPWLRIAVTASAQVVEVPASGAAPAALLVIDRDRLQVVRAR